MTINSEKKRLEEVSTHSISWKKWGPYLSERQWGTVREDYSSDGDAWNYFTHEHARSRAYRWGEDGIGGISDDKQRLCFALAMWNGKDQILKERLFGLTNSEGNHGEDVKEYYFYLDNTPTHSYMKYLYKYSQSEYPYAKLIETNRQRSRNGMEYELMEAGVFNENRYFDVFVEYAKDEPEDILIKITVINHGPQAAELHLLPTLWFRNDWASWVVEPAKKPNLKEINSHPGIKKIAANTDLLGTYYLYCEGEPELLFTENETNNSKIGINSPNAGTYSKDGINNYIVNRQQNAINPEKIGTKVSAHYNLSLNSQETKTIHLRLTNKDHNNDLFGVHFDQIFIKRKQEADEFYKSITPSTLSQDAANVMRQAIAGMLWSKQYYHFNGHRWLNEHYAHPLDPNSRHFRNRDWFHMINEDIISMPDKWEYPWYAAWDLAFHSIPLSIVDPEFAKEQIELMLRAHYLHPGGQVPAYEWNFSDTNPPVHAWASLFLYRNEQATRGKGDLNFLNSAFSKLLLNFAWWVNRKDRFGKNVFEGGFLGLDNIGVFDRSAPIPTGGYIEQSDGTAWMALFTQNMFEIAIELTCHNKSYQDMIFKFADHFLYIAASMNLKGNDGMWDEEDGFYYDLLRLPDGKSARLKVRSIVGLLPLCATSVIEKWQREASPQATKALYSRLKQMPNLINAVHLTGPDQLGEGERSIISLVNEEKLRRILTKMLDENEFLSPYGIRSLSKYHEKNPYIFHHGSTEYRVDYLPAESNTGMFGGNSNWRGPIWMPINVMIIRALLSFYAYYGDKFKIECPTGSGNQMNLFEVSKEIARRLSNIFLRNSEGKRPVYGGTEKFQNDPHWRDHILFYEYFHGDNGAGLGASHQTGWTGLIAKLIQIYAYLDPQKVLKSGRDAIFKGD